MSHNILLIEDAKDCQILVKEILGKTASVKIATTLQEAKGVLTQEKFDLILLDLSLPDGDGMEFFSSLQSAGAGPASTDSEDTPVIFLTAKSETAMQVTAFSLGADDYIVKPLRPLEFRARVEAKLKRIAARRSQSTLLARGELRIELSSQRAYLEGADGKRELDLTGREFKLLCHLARHEGTVFTRDQLIAAVWGVSVHVLDRTVDTHIYTLRKKLGNHSHYVESEVGQGYRLNSASARKGRAAA